MNAMSVLSIVAIVKLMSGRKFRKAVEAKEPVPPKSAASLSECMETARELGLTIPAALQNKAVHYGSKKNTA